MRATHRGLRDDGRGAAVGYALRGAEHAKLAAAGVAFGAINFSLIGVLLFGAWLSFRRGQQLGDRAGTSSA